MSRPFVTLWQVENDSREPVVTGGIKRGTVTARGRFVWWNSWFAPSVDGRGLRRKLVRTHSKIFVVTLICTFCGWPRTAKEACTNTFNNLCCHTYLHLLWMAADCEGSLYEHIQQSLLSHLFFSNVCHVESKNNLSPQLICTTYLKYFLRVVTYFILCTIYSNKVPLNRFVKTQH